MATSVQVALRSVGQDALARVIRGPKLGSGDLIMGGTGLGPSVAAVPDADVTGSTTSYAGPCRGCTRQVAHVVSYVATMLDRECKARLLILSLDTRGQ